jgi:hypothetical protein
MRSSLLELVEGTPYAGTLMRISLLELVEGTPYAGTLMRISLLELSAEELLSGLMLELVEGTPYAGTLMRNSLLDELYSGFELLSPPVTDIVSPQLLQKNAVSATANFSKCL